MRRIGNLMWFLLVVIGGPMCAFAHCDTLDGPVVRAGREAFENADVKRALIWVKREHEAETETAFKRALAVRKLGVEAKELAEMFFFETLVRLHRAGEGAPYTGLKPAGAKVDPAIAAVDKAVVTDSIASLSKALREEIGDGLERRFKEVVAKRKFATNDVEAGREYVGAYVELMHYVEAIRDIVASVSSEQDGKLHGERHNSH